MNPRNHPDDMTAADYMEEKKADKRREQKKATKDETEKQDNNHWPGCQCDECRER